MKTWPGRRHEIVRLGVVALGAALLASLTPSAAAQTVGGQPSKATIAIKANENNLTPFTLTLLGLSC